jgi:hypothetical protein
MIAAEPVRAHVHKQTRTEHRSGSRVTAVAAGSQQQASKMWICSKNGLCKSVWCNSGVKRTDLSPSRHQSRRVAPSPHAQHGPRHPSVLGQAALYHKGLTVVDVGVVAVAAAVLAVPRSSEVVLRTQNLSRDGQNSLYMGEAYCYAQKMTVRLEPRTRSLDCQFCPVLMLTAVLLDTLQLCT